MLRRAGDLMSVIVVSACVGLAVGATGVLAVQLVLYLRRQKREDISTVLEEGSPWHKLAERFIKVPHRGTFGVRQDRGIDGCVTIGASAEAYATLEFDAGEGYTLVICDPRRIPSETMLDIYKGDEHVTVLPVTDTLVKEALAAFRHEDVANNLLTLVHE